MTKDKIVREIVSTKSLVRWEIENLGLASVNFSGVNLEKAKLINCRLVSANFQGSNLSGVLFQHCKLNNADFASADLRGARFEKCSGLSPEQIADLEKAGAVVADPVGRFGPLVVVVLVIAAALALFYIAGGRELFNKGTGAGNTSTVEEPKTMTQEEVEAKGNEAFQRGDFAEAVLLWGEILAGKTKDFDFQLRYLRALIGAEQFDKVFPTVEKMLSQQPGAEIAVQASLSLAEAQLRMNRMEDGAALYSKLLNEYGRDPQAKRAILMNQGTVLWHINQYDLALKVFDQLLKASDPDQRAGVRINIAMVHHDAGNAVAENAAYRQAMNDALAPAIVRANAKIKLAENELAGGKIAQAQTMIEQAANAGGDPGQVLSALHLVATAWKEKEQPEKAIAVYEKAIELLKGNEGSVNDARVHLANLLLELNRKNEALDLYRLVAEKTTNPAQKKWAEETVQELTSQPAGEPTPPTAENP